MQSVLSSLQGLILFRVDCHLGTLRIFRLPWMVTTVCNPSCCSLQILFCCNATGLANSTVWKKSRMAFFTRTVFGVDRIRTTSVNLEVKGVARCHFPRRMI